MLMKPVEGLSLIHILMGEVPLSEVPWRLTRTLPEGITVHRCYDAARPFKELCYVNYIITLEYEAGTPVGAENAIRALLSRDALVVTKKSKKAKSGETQVDLCLLYTSGKTATNELSAADGKLREAEERAEELSKRVSGYHDQNIAILGIFAGLVVTFSGVIQITSSSLENLSEITTLKITFFVCLSFFFLFDIVFLLMYCISKLSGSSIANACKKRDCNNC